MKTYVPFKINIVAIRKRMKEIREFDAKSRQARRIAKGEVS